MADPGQLVAQGRRQRANEATRARGARGREAVREGALADDRGDRAVTGGRLDHMAAAERGAPQGDPLAVDRVEAASVGERCGPVAQLALDVEQLARLAVAVAEVAVGEDQRRDAGVREPARVGLEPQLAGRAEAVAEDHQRRPLGVRHEQPGPAVVTA